jgi:hypothetical protein
MPAFVAGLLDRRRPSVRISGYAASSEDVDRLRKAIDGIGGIAKVAFEVGVRVWPYCEVVAVLSAW